MNVVSLIAQLAEQDIRLRLEDGNLRYSAPDGAMTPEVIAQLRAAKSDIITFLQQSEHSQISLLPVADRTLPLPISYAQQRLWFIHQLDPANTAYHIHVTLHIKGNLQPAPLGKACTEIIRRHEILRTHYLQQGGNVSQIIRPAFEFTIQPEWINSDALSQARHEELHQPFQLDDAIFRIRLWQMASADFALSFTIHHIAADGWSLGIFVNELVQLYESYSQNRTPRLPVLERHYADYALWQTLNTAQHDRQLEYWKQQLANVPNLNLPYDSAPGTLVNNDGGFVDYCLDARVTEKLSALNKAQGTTLFMSLLATLSVLLHRYTQQNDFCVGTPVAGRSNSQLESMIGCFINVLAIRCTPSSTQTFSEYLQTTKTTSSEAFNQQEMPFERIVQELVTERDLAINPIFQVMLSVQNAPVSAINTLNGLSITPYTDTETAAQIDLGLTAQEHNGEINLRFGFKKALFRQATIERFCQHFVRLLTAVMANPDQRIAELPLVSAEEIRQELAAQQHSQVIDPASFRVLHELFEEQVARTPDAIALVFTGTHMSYAELNNKANILAHQLIESGVGIESLVAIYQHRSLEMVVSLLAILKAGGAYVPIDPNYPAARVLDILNDSQPLLVLTQHDLSNELHALPSELPDTFKTFHVDLHQLTADGNNTSNPAGKISPQNLAYVLFTSGSTGKPKGVMIEHAALCNHMLWMQHEFDFTANDRFLQKTPFVFDASVWEFYAPLLIGATMVIAEPEDHKDPVRLGHLIHTQNITVVQFVPSLLNVFLQLLEARHCQSLRKVFCGGEALSASLLKTFYRSLENSMLINLYGPTEATIDASFSVCPPDTQHITIGQPIPNVSYYILDNNLNYLPSGIPGELYIGGTSLARGYLNRLDLTANSFIPNPFPGKTGERLYKTGDLVRRLPEGNFDYLGRIDHQVKIRGLRIELGEIEEHLQKIPGIKESVVLAVNKDQQADNQYLVAYYLATDISPAHTVIRQQLLQALPQYMIPACFIALESWPLNANGKIDRQFLPEPDWAQMSRPPYVAPENATQITLAGIWSDVLGVENIGIHDSFFELGGHSLTATQAIARARESFAVELPLRQIFENPTIEAIAELIDKNLLEKAVFSNAAITDDDTESFIL